MTADTWDGFINLSNGHTSRRIFLSMYHSCSTVPAVRHDRVHLASLRIRIRRKGVVKERLRRVGYEPKHVVRSRVIFKYGINDRGRKRDQQAVRVLFAEAAGFDSRRCLDSAGQTANKFLYASSKSTCLATRALINYNVREEAAMERENGHVTVLSAGSDVSRIIW
jgi:hypothetical protein